MDLELVLDVFKDIIRPVKVFFHDKKDGRHVPQFSKEAHMPVFIKNGEYLGVENVFFEKIIIRDRDPIHIGI